MQKGSVFVVLIALFLSGCSTLKVWTFKPDKELSGVTKKQITYLDIINDANKPDNSDSRLRSEEQRNKQIVQENIAAFPNEELRDRIYNTIPSEIIRTNCHTDYYEPDEIIVTAAGAIAVIAVKYAIDQFFAATDSRLKKLRSAAVANYGGKAIIKSLRLASEPCFGFIRMAEDEIASLYVFKVNNITDVVYSQSESHKEIIGHYVDPIFVHVNLAAAQTKSTKVDYEDEDGNDGKRKASYVKADSTLSIYSESENSKGENAIVLLSNSTFSFGKIEITKSYCGNIVDFEDLGCDFALKTEKGPVFLPIEGVPKIGVASASFIERGAAANMSDATASEIISRKAFQSTVETLVKDLVK